MKLRTTYLCSDSVGSSREQLGDTGSLETSLGETECGAESSTTGSDDNGIVLVVNERV